MSKSKPEIKPVYDEATLKEFVVKTHGTNLTSTANQLDSILASASSDSTAFRQTISFLETPFSGPNSFYRNEILYVKLLQAKMNSRWFDSVEKEKVRYDLYLLMQNRVGDAANDFVFVTPAGYKKRMYDVGSSFTLLYFYDPECQACKEIKESVSASPVLSKKVTEGKLKIIAIYTGKNEKIWLEHLNEYPKEWIHGWDEDESLLKNSLYDLKAIPSMYLLDSNRKVLLKDCADVGRVAEVVWKGDDVLSLKR